MSRICLTEIGERVLELVHELYKVRIHGLWLWLTNIAPTRRGKRWWSRTDRVAVGVL